MDRRTTLNGLPKQYVRKILPRRGSIGTEHEFYQKLRYEVTVLYEKNGCLSNLLGNMQIEILWILSFVAALVKHQAREHFRRCSKSICTQCILCFAKISLGRWILQRLNVIILIELTIVLKKWMIKSLKNSWNCYATALIHWISVHDWCLNEFHGDDMTRHFSWAT